MSRFHTEMCSRFTRVSLMALTLVMSTASQTQTPSTATCGTEVYSAADALRGRAVCPGNAKLGHEFTVRSGGLLRSRPALRRRAVQRGDAEGRARRQDRALWHG